MSLSDLASLGSFVSGIAVLVSFVFLALQMRQSNINQQALIQMGRSTGVIESIYHQLDPQLRSVMQRGRRGDPSITEDEIETFVLSSYAMFLRFEDTYLEHRAGTIHHRAWEVASSRITHLFIAPGMRACWKLRRTWFDSDFVAAVDRLVAQARLTPWQEPAEGWAAVLADEERLAAQ